MYVPSSTPVRQGPVLHSPPRAQALPPTPPPSPLPHTHTTPGDLFDFDLEVEPLLEVLVGKVLEQGLMEVLQEEELAAMRRHQVTWTACAHHGATSARL